MLARVTGAVEDNGSFRDFVTSDRYALAPVIAWKPSADTTITLEGDLISTAQTFDRGIVPLGATCAPCPAAASSASRACRRPMSTTPSASCASSTGSTKTGC
ncbi:hypothetical protein ACU4GA_05775 [Methylobacterium oryzae CBMB20]